MEFVQSMLAAAGAGPLGLVFDNLRERLGDNIVFFQVALLGIFAIVATLIFHFRSRKMEPLHQRVLRLAPTGVWNGLPAKDVLRILKSGSVETSTLKKAQRQLAKAKNKPRTDPAAQQNSMLASYLEAVITVYGAGENWGGHDIPDSDAQRPERQAALEKLLRSAPANFPEALSETRHLYNTVCSVALEPEAEIPLCEARLAALCAEAQKAGDASLYADIVSAAAALALRAKRADAIKTLDKLKEQAESEKNEPLAALLADLVRSVDPEAQAAKGEATVQTEVTDLCARYGAELGEIFVKEPLMNSDVIRAQSLLSTLLCAEAAGSFARAATGPFVEEFCDLVNRASDAEVGQRQFTPATRMREVAAQLITARRAAGGVRETPSYLAVVEMSQVDKKGNGEKGKKQQR